MIKIASKSTVISLWGQQFETLHNPVIVIASEAKQSHNTLISHEITASRHASLAAKGSLAPRNDQN